MEPSAYRKSMEESGTFAEGKVEMSESSNFGTENQQNSSN